MDERSLDVVRRQLMRNDDRSVAAAGGDGSKSGLVDVACRLQAMRTLPPPDGDRRVSSPPAIDDADREVRAVEIYLRLENGRSMNIACDRKIDRRIVDGIGVQP